MPCEKSGSPFSESCKFLICSKCNQSFKHCLFATTDRHCTLIEISGLGNKVLHLLLVQNNLHITGSQEKLIDWLGLISPSNSLATYTRNANASALATTGLRPNCQKPEIGGIQNEPEEGKNRQQQPRSYSRW